MFPELEHRVKPDTKYFGVFFSNLSGISGTVKCGCTLHSLVSGVSNVTAHFPGESASLRD